MPVTAPVTPPPTLPVYIYLHLPVCLPVRSEASCLSPQRNLGMTRHGRGGWGQTSSLISWGGSQNKQSCPAKLTVASPVSCISSTAVQLVPSERGRCFGRAGRQLSQSLPSKGEWEGWKERGWGGIVVESDIPLRA